MGTNRQPIEGSQIPELLEIWKTVKQGVKSEDTRHSFCIPRQWIETLDPRIKERIRKEIRTRLVEKDKSKKAKFVEKLEQDLNKKKISQDLYEERLSQYDELFQVQVQNTIAKEIEKAHTYHFNLQNYRSGLTDEQIKKWQEVFNIPSPLWGEGQGEGGTQTLDERCNQLTYNPSPDDTLKILPTFNAKNALEMDIAREFLHNMPEDALNTSEFFKTLNNVLKSDHQFPKVELNNLITLQNGFIEIEDEKEYKLITCKLHGQGIVFRELILGKDIKTKKQQVVKANQLLVAEIDAKLGGYGLIPADCEGAIVSSHYFAYSINQNELFPDYLSVILRSKEIKEQVSAYVKGATNYAAIRPNDFLKIKIPLPLLEIQKKIVFKIKKQESIIEGAKSLENAFFVNDDYFDKYEKQPLSRTVKYIQRRISIDPNRNYTQIRLQLWGRGPVQRLSETKQDIKTLNQFIAKKNDFIVSKIDARNGAMGIITNELDGAIVTNDFPTFEIDQKVMFPNFLKYLAKTTLLHLSLAKLSEGATGRKRVDVDDILNLNIPLPPLPVQQEIVAKLDKEMAALEGVRLLRQEAVRRIEGLLEEVWGE